MNDYDERKNYIEQLKQILKEIEESGYKNSNVRRAKEEIYVMFKILRREIPSVTNELVRENDGIVDFSVPLSVN